MDGTISLGHSFKLYFLCLINCCIDLHIFLYCACFVCACDTCNHGKYFFATIPLLFPGYHCHDRSLNFVRYSYSYAIAFWKIMRPNVCRFANPVLFAFATWRMMIANNYSSTSSNTTCFSPGGTNA